MSNISEQTTTVHLTDENFESEVIDSETPTLVDFWAEWCGPCKIMGPAVEKIAEKFEGRVRVGKLNVDENRQMADRFGIRGIPSLFLFRGGKIVDQRVGVQSPTQIEALIGQVFV
ncbi:MAG: thioredoxin [Nitrospinaceae bacterium]|jgi:thioredoxin 1|nr:thioredoxin [Nitrospinaceae bacterium]MBT3433650.1 thioredoxin [Nitrospinaceae bacterium]MBT3822875.1 thioredoxin [Nitrospinaceae bacterium]MBT4093578.1 thioredoxin [Nitrospinaceae bacterium]MBT4431105.1 thioredoxin [Nitrospinaceae bacterium]